LRPTEGLRRSRRWDNEGCFALDYLRSESDAEPRRAFVHTVKAGDPAALDDAARLLSVALAERERRLGTLNAGLIAIPGHLARSATQVPEQLCRRISQQLPWLRHEPGALQRIASVRSSATSANRPSVSEHLQSLALAPQVPPVRCRRQQVIERCQGQIDDLDEIGWQPGGCQWGQWSVAIN
jgi:hypothetical protein